MAIEPAKTQNLVPPTEKAPKAPKAPKEKKEPSVRRSNFETLYPRSAPLAVLAETNPKKAGSKAFERFAWYYKVKTVGEFLDADATHGYNDVTYDVGHGFIKVG